MGRGRRAGPSSGDDSDDGASPVGGLSSQLGKGSKKQWKPGMSGKEQKARAKEQRLEQERRKAEREKRNEDKREKREQLEHESGEIPTSATRPKSASRRARQHDDAGGAVQHHEVSHSHSSPRSFARGFVHLDAAQIRRDVRRLFGRIQHGGNVRSLDSGRTVACDVGDVFVVVAEDAAAERRKSGADAWSARVQKGEETETPLAEFLLEKARFENASTPEAGEPPYHRVRRVFARRRGEEDEPRVVEETLWDAHVSAEDGSGAAARRMASLNLGGFGHSPDTRGGSPRSYAYGSPSASRIGGFQASETASFRAGGDAPRRGRAVAASSLLPGHCWEEVFARCDPASVARLGATCAELAELARSSLVRQAQHAKLFGRAAPVGSPARFPRPPRAGAPIPPSPPASRAALETAAARKGWAATCASFVAADPWLPRHRIAGSEDEDEDGDEDDRDGARSSDDGEDRGGSASDGGVAFDEDDDDFDDFATRPVSDRAAHIVRAARSSQSQSHDVFSRRTRSVSVSFPARSATRAPRPRAEFRGVGPQSARHVLANDAAAVSCDGAKIKLWFHGGDGVTESGKRIATLPNPAGSKAWTALAAGPGTFLAGDAAGRLTVWDADTLEVKHARRDGVAEWDEETQTAVTRANAFALTSLAAIPNATLVACASRDTSVVRFLDIGSPAEAPQVPLVHSHVSVDCRGSGDARDFGRERFGAADDAAWTSFGVDALAISGGEVTYGAAAGDRAFAPRGPGSGAPKLWAVARGSGALGDARLVSVDLGTLRVGPDALTLPEAFFPELERVAAAAPAPLRSRFSLATYGDLVVAARDGVAAMWDARVASAARAAPVALFRDDAEAEPLAPRGPADSATADAEIVGGVAVDEWAVWVSRGGGDGVRLYDARRAAGPPRGKSRWHDGDALRCSPVAVYGVAGNADAKRIRVGERGVGAFARGGDGALVVAPACLSALSPGEASGDAGASPRCSVYTSARHGDGGDGDGGDAFRDGAAWEDGFGKPRAGKKKAAKKARKKYPKRQGGKFRARTAGG